MKKEQRSCVECEKTGVKERHRCESCAREYNRLRAKQYDQCKIKNLPTSVCVVCGDPIKVWRASQNLITNKHTRCKYQESHDDVEVANFRKIAREVSKDLGLIVDRYNVVHHVDEDPSNNFLENLWIMHPKAHASLHAYLRRHRSLWAKGQSKNSEDCWKTLRDHLTTAWLETTSAKVTKLDDIGQSAAEPLSLKKYGEGSEAMHGAPKGEA